MLPQFTVYAKILCLLMVVISGALCTVQDFVIMSKCARNKAIHIAHDGKVSVTDIPMTQNITIAGLFSTVSEEDFKLTLFAKETQMYLCFNNHWRLVGMKKLQERCYFKEAIKYGYFEYHSFVDVKRRIGFTHRGKPVGPRKNVEDECYSFTRVEGKKFFSTQPTSASLIAATSSAGSHNSHKNRNHNNNNNNNNNGHSNSYSNSGSNNSRNRNNSNNSNNINNINNNNNNLISANKHNNAHQHRVRHHHNDPNMVAKRQSHATGRRVNNNNNNNSNNNNSNNKRKLCNRSNLLNTNQTTAAALTTQVAVVDKDSVVTPVVRKQRKIKIKCGNRGQRARFLNPKDPEHRRIVFGQQQLEQQQLQQLQLQSTQSSSTQQQLDYNTQDLSSTSPTFQDSYTTSNGESGSGSFSSIPDEYSNDDASAILPDLPNSLDSSTEYLNDSNSYSSDKQINTTNIYLNSDDTDNINSNSNINTVTVTIAVTLTSNDLSTNISKNSTNNVSSDVNVTNINKNYNNNNNNNYYNNNNNNNNNSNYNKRINDNSMLDSQTTTATAASSSSSSSLSSSSPSISSFSSASSLSSTSSSSSSTTTTTTTTLKKYYKKSKPIIISASFQSTVGDQRGPSPILGIGLRDLKVNDNNLTPTNNLDKTTKTSYNDKTLPLRRKLTTVGS